MVTSELPQSLLLKGILFCSCFLFLAVQQACLATNPPNVSSLGSRWWQLPTLEMEVSIGTLLYKEHNLGVGQAWDSVSANQMH